MFAERNLVPFLLEKRKQSPCIFFLYSCRRDRADTTFVIDLSMVTSASRDATSVDLRCDRAMTFRNPIMTIMTNHLCPAPARMRSLLVARSRCSVMLVLAMASVFFWRVFFLARDSFCCLTLFGPLSTVRTSTLGESRQSYEDSTQAPYAGRPTISEGIIPRRS